MTRWALLTVAVCGAAALGACDGSGGGASGGGGIGRVDSSALVTVITADEPRVLDPHATQNGGDVKVIHQIFETLVRVDPDDVNALLPALAASWEVAADGLSVTFHIRPGVTFHDGTPLDAAAAKLSLDRLREQDLKPAASPYAPEFQDVLSFDVEGETLVMRLSAPVVRVALRNLSMFCASIVSPTVLEATRGMERNAATAYATAHAVGTGAFRVEAFDPAAKVTRLVANDTYWGGAPSVHTLVFKPVTDESTRTEYLTKGSGHVMVDDVPRQHWDRVEASDTMTLHAWWALNVCYLGINANHEKTRESVLRHAIQLAIRRDPILAHYEGTARSTYSLVAQPMAEYDPELRVDGWDDDVATRLLAAKMLVEQAGAKGRTVTIYFPQRPRPYLPRPQDIADTVRQQLKEIGLDARIQAEENGVLFDSVSTGRYELILIGWMTDNGDPDNFYGPLADGSDGEPSNNNTSRVFDERAHAGIAAARRLSDPNDRKTAYREVERILQNDVRGYVPLVNTKQAVAYSRTIHGVVIDGIGHYRFDRATLE